MTDGNKKLKFREYFGRGFTFFLVALLCIGFYFFLLRFEMIADYARKIIGILQPIIYGVVIAYLLNPIVNFVEKPVCRLLNKKLKKEKKARKLARGIGVFAGIFAGIAVIIALGFALLPELFRSIRGLVLVLPGRMNEFIDWVTEVQRSDSEFSVTLKNLLERGADYLENWLRTDLLNQINIMMTSLTTGVINFFKSLMNVLIGFIVSVYLLFSKDHFASQGKKIVYATAGIEKGNFFIHIVRKSHLIFGGFISGKLLDSLIIGILCFAGLSVLRMPYVLLVSVIVGVTNVIPFFGPYIGAIPSAFLITLEDPVKGLYFLIFILILQQLDGNVIGPKILGDSTGLSSFWVMFAILLGGGLFGFIGMVMGVPTFAVIYYIVNLIINRRLEERKLPKETVEYDELDYVDSVKKKFIYQKEETESK